MAKCLECDCGQAKKHDPRTPPLEVGLCLCVDCFVWICQEMIDELQAEIAECTNQQFSVHKSAQTDCKSLIESSDQAEKRA